MQQRKVEIPFMQPRAIFRLYKKMKPIKWENEKPVYLREMTEEQIMEAEFQYLRLRLGETFAPVKEKLAFLADVKMIHKCEYGWKFKATVAEIIQQIPKEFLDRTVAFEIVYKAESKYECEIFKDEYDAEYFVSVVRLYQEKEEEMQEATRPTCFESNEFLPIGMTQEEFQKVKDVLTWMRERGIS